MEKQSMPIELFIIISTVFTIASPINIVIIFSPFFDAPKEYKWYSVFLWVIVFGTSINNLYVCSSFFDLKKVMNTHGLYEVSVPVEKVTVSEIQWIFKGNIPEGDKK